MQEKSRKRRSALLNAASRDIQRAMDLEPFNSELFWTKAIIQYQSQANPDQITDTFLKAFELHPNLQEINGGHYSAISKMFYDRAQGYVDGQKKRDSSSSELALLEIAIQIWQNKNQQAKQLCRTAIQKFPNHPDIRAISQWVDNLLDPANGQSINTADVTRFRWRYLLSNAEASQVQGKKDTTESLLRRALAAAQVPWQTSHSQVKLSVCLIEQDKFSEAAELTQKTITLDRAVNLTPIEKAVARVGPKADSVAKICRNYRSLTQPKIAYSNADLISKPAILNAGFELGLSYHWAPYAKRTTTASWNNFGQSRTSAEAVPTDAKQGQRCLRLMLECPAEEKSYGQMTQTVPVTPGQTYELTFWAQANSLSNNAVRIGVMDEKQKTFVAEQTVVGGDYSWKQFRIRFQSKTNHIVIGIRAQGNGQFWLDDLQINAVQ